MSEHRVRQPHALAEALGRAAAPLIRRRGFADGLVIRDWPAIVGERLAAECTPERLRFPPKQRHGGTLTLRVGNSGLALELQHLQPQLIERINLHFGYEAVARLAFVHGPLPRRTPPPPRPRPALSGDDERDLARIVAAVDDPDLRATLESLGRSVLGRNTPI